MGGLGKHWKNDDVDDYEFSLFSRWKSEDTDKQIDSNNITLDKNEILKVIKKLSKEDLKWLLNKLK